MEKRIEELEDVLEHTLAKLDDISVLTPICANCGAIYLIEKGYHYECKICKFNTSKILIKYKRLPK